MLIDNNDDDREESGDDEIRPGAVPRGLKKFIDVMYTDINDPDIATDDYFANRTILTTTNTVVHRINEAVSKRLSLDQHQRNSSTQADVEEGCPDNDDAEPESRHGALQRNETTNVFISDGDTREFPLRLRRKQFPVVPAFAMTINKAQGQTVQNLGLYLATPCFSHGQLYVALSRVTSRSKFKALIEYPELEEDDDVYTDNIVYRQIFNTN
ncbi:unnamed protein product [Phytophthora fragariaefolia]|uniref:Unnamed protein product n=1 Tax=Phytophthora fragariaefolia TaxID=1490495 RepID=A0A9W7D3K6_9STRA|nr:unnamed protein product [Phytophthora fragariaefolia]